MLRKSKDWVRFQTYELFVLFWCTSCGAAWWLITFAISVNVSPPALNSLNGVLFWLGFWPVLVVVKFALWVRSFGLFLDPVFIAGLLGALAGILVGLVAVLMLRRQGI